MFAQAVVATTLTLAATAVATMPASRCTTRPVQCCDKTRSTITPSLATLLDSLGITSGVEVPIGITCSPISVVGAGSGATCSNEPVCCKDNKFNGVVALGCSPVNLDL